MIFEILMDLGKLVCLILFGAGKRWAPKNKTKKQMLGEMLDPNDNTGWVLKLRLWPDSTFSYLTTPDTGRCRQILWRTGF